MPSPPLPPMLLFRVSFHRIAGPHRMYVNEIFFLYVIRVMCDLLIHRERLYALIHMHDIMAVPCGNTYLCHIHTEIGRKTWISPLIGYRYYRNICIFICLLVLSHRQEYFIIFLIHTNPSILRSPKLYNNNKTTTSYNLHFTV